MTLSSDWCRLIDEHTAAVSCKAGSCFLDADRTMHGQPTNIARRKQPLETCTLAVTAFIASSTSATHHVPYRPVDGNSFVAMQPCLGTCHVCKRAGVI